MLQLGEAISRQLGRNAVRVVKDDQETWVTFMLLT